MEINLSSDVKDSVLFSDFVDSISYLTLKTDNEVEIGSIENIRFTDSCIVAFDPRANQILLFNRDGDFIRKIGSRGRGHGEFIRPLRMDIDTVDKLILIYDIVRGSVLKYGYDNDYFGCDSIGHASDMVSIRNGNYLVTDYNEESDQAGIYLVKSKPYRRRKLIGCRDKVPMMKPWDFFLNKGKVCMMSRPYEDLLMEWNGDSLVTVLDFKVNPHPTDKDLGKMLYSPKDKAKFPERISFCNSDRWFYAYYWINDEIRYIFSDKITGENKVVNSLTNDIDGIYGIELPICVDNTWVSLISEEKGNGHPRLQFLHLKK